MATTAISNQKTIQQIIDETSSKTAARNTGEMGKDEFLNLLVTQLKYQDPLNPVDDKEFIGQMAQFSALEQMQNLNSSMSQAQAYSLIGKHVKANFVDETTKESSVVEGDVTGVKVSKGKTYVVVKGKDVPIEKISEVADGAKTQLSDISRYANIIGFKAQGNVYNPETGEVVPVEGIVKSLQRGLYEDYVLLDGVEALVSGVVTNNSSTDKDFIKDYLEEHDGDNEWEDREVKVYVKDKETGVSVAVKAKLREYRVNGDGTITAVLDELYVPVESIETVSPANKQKSDEEILLQKILDKLSEIGYPAGGN
ncbi:MAG: flagellar biosynthesis protein FlgD [Firmicutes bacterium]|nr:flagellar biosynthesis protein FlgD [Bacillota bacterium]